MKLLIALMICALPQAYAAAKANSPLVKQVSKLKFEVSRGEAEKVTGDPVGLMASFTALPSFADGPFTGVRVSSFSKKCLLPSFGIKEGDVISSVNGTDLRMPTDVYDVASKLEKAKPGTVVRVKLKRDGEELSQNYLVVE